MNGSVQFETAENVQVSYRIAGLGTRFVAWLTDSILLFIAAVVIFIGMLIAGASTDIISEETRRGRSHAMLYFLAIWWLAYTLGSLLYFGLCELCMRGQTIGKRQTHIRVVGADGFSLDPLAVFLRTIFRVVDHLPPLYVVPLFTAKSQRLGDLVAGTIVVIDERARFGNLREQLAARNPAECRFQFDRAVLNRLRELDVQAIEKILERWSSISHDHREELSGRLVSGLASRLQVECPPQADHLTFLNDLLTAEYRRQHRKLG